MASHWSNHNLISWIFFAADAKPTSMRRALAERLAEEEIVIIVDRPVSFLRDKELPALEKRCRRFSGSSKPWHYRPLYFPERLPGFGKIIKLLNRHLLQQDLNQLLPKNNERIVCYDSPTQDHLVGKLSEAIRIYLAVDDKTLTVCGEPIYGELEAEKRLLSKVDKVVCVSKTLAEVLRSRVPNRQALPIHVLPNGYNERLFYASRDLPEPDALSSIPKPRILVAGHISERIDWEGIVATSRIGTRWIGIFVGPADQAMQEKVHSNLGVHGYYHPPIPVTDVPAWIYHCDVCAVPYRLNPFTRASHALKAIEYLAMGAPVLSTRISSLEHYDRAIEWVNESDGESYARALNEFMNQSNSQELRRYQQRAVAGDSLKDRVDQFRQFVLPDIGVS